MLSLVNMFSMILTYFGPWLKVLNDYFWDYITDVYISEEEEIKLPKRFKVFQDCKIA